MKYFNEFMFWFSVGTFGVHISHLVNEFSFMSMIGAISTLILVCLNRYERV
jgi:hypothetical protein